MSDLLLPLSVLAIVVLLGGWHVIKIRKANKLIRGALRAALAKLEAIKSEELVEQFGHLSSFFREEPVLQHSWNEFEEALVKETVVEPDGSSRIVRVRNTLQSGEFFSYSELLDERLESEFTRHLPGVFTAIGILGTFFGIGSGLYSAGNAFGAMKGAPVEQQMLLMNDATQSLVTHIGPAFAASFCAVAAAVIFILFERHTYRKLEELLSQVQIQIDRLFPRVTQHELLTQLISEAERQSASTKNLSHEFATSLRPVLDELLEKQANAMEKSQAEALTRMTTALSKSFEPLAEKLNETVKEIKKDSTDSSTETLQQLVGSFQSSLSNAADGQLQEMSRAISGTAGLLESQKASLESFVTTISQTMESQLGRLAEQMTEQQRTAEVQSRESSRQMTELAATLGSTFEALQKQTADSSTELFKDMSSGISSLLTETLDNQKTANQALMSSLEESNTKLAESLRQLTSGLEEMSSRIAGSTDRLVERINETTGSTISELSKTVNEATSGTVSELNGSLSSALERIATQTERLFDASKSQSEELSRQFKAMTEKFESSSALTSEKTAETSKALEAVLNKVSLTSGEVDNMIGKFAAQTDSMTAVATNARETAANFKAVSNDLVEQQRKASALVDSVNKIEKALEFQAQAAKVQQSTLQEALTGFEKAALELRDTATAQSSASAELGEKTRQSILDFQDSINATTKSLSGATQNYFKDIDDALSAITGHLRGAVEDLAEPLQDLADSVGAMKQ